MKAFYNDGVYNVFNSMIKESKYVNEVMKKHFNKELVMTKKDNEDFENLLNVGFAVMIILMLMLNSEIIVISLENIETLLQSL